ncbi:MAG: hypothetical protein ACXAEU_13360 [Candidatus Hodarchaeales archaeon]
MIFTPFSKRENHRLQVTVKKITPRRKKVTDWLKLKKTVKARDENF